MNPRGTFERVHDAIRRQLEAGGFAPGDHLEPSHLADQFNSSITPVRDALQRLVGERLVEASPGDGFRVPLLTEVGLRQLYEWNSQLLQLALRRPSETAPGREEGPETVAAETGAALVCRTAILFAAIAARGGNIEQLAALQSMNSRLSMVRHREIAIVANVADELAALEHGHDRGDVATLRRSLLSYHRRRQKLADRLVVALQLR